MKTKFIKKSLVICLLAIAISVFILAGCSSDDEENGPDPEVRILEVADQGILETAPVIRGRDGGYSAVYEDRSVWLYGDTFFNEEDEYGYKLHGNSWSWTDDFDASDGINDFRERGDSVGTPENFFPLTTEEREFNDAHMNENCTQEPCGARWALWPADIIADPERNRMLVFYEKVYSEPGDFNFHGVGRSIAVWNDFYESPERPVFGPGEEYPTLMFKENEPGFGSAAIADGSMMYVYGCDLDGTVKPCRLGRVPLEHALNGDAWEFYTGQETWTSDISMAEPVFNGNDIMSVSYNPCLERYLAVYSQPMDTAVMFRTAMNPEGPWSRPVKAFDAEAPANDTGWVYDALTHPEYNQDNGCDIYITYSGETGFLSFEVKLVSVQIEKFNND